MCMCAVRPPGPAGSEAPRRGVLQAAADRLDHRAVSKTGKDVRAGGAARRGARGAPNRPLFNERRCEHCAADAETREVVKDPQRRSASSEVPQVRRSDHGPLV